MNHIHVAAKYQPPVKANKKVEALAQPAKIAWCALFVSTSGKQEVYGNAYTYAPEFETNRGTFKLNPPEDAKDGDKTAAPLDQDVADMVALVKVLDILEPREEGASQGSSWVNVGMKIAFHMDSDMVKTYAPKKQPDRQCHLRGYWRAFDLNSRGKGLITRPSEDAVTLLLDGLCDDLLSGEITGREVTPDHAQASRNQNVISIPTPSTATAG